MNKLIVASIPRSGSTWVHRAICGLPPSSSTSKNPFIKESVGWSIYKTHRTFEYWQDKITSKDKIVFIFGDIINSVISTKKKRYEKNHFKNCGYTGPTKNKNIYEEDFLNYELIFDSWVNCNLPNLLILRYETFSPFDLYNFVPFSFDLPSRRPRANYTNVKKSNIIKIQNTYKNLIKKSMSLNV
jgi:predicted nucleic-acid-binding Zn-ribbon protein